jgi:hypothetical protein
MTPFLKERAQETLEGLCEHMRWAIAERSSRALLADEFSGFSEDPVPISLDAIVLNPGEAKRLGVMEQLRREQAEAPRPFRGALGVPMRPKRPTTT